MLFLLAWLGKLLLNYFSRTCELWYANCQKVSMATPKLRSISRADAKSPAKPVVGLRPLKERNKRSEAMVGEQVREVWFLEKYKFYWSLPDASRNNCITPQLGWSKFYATLIISLWELYQNAIILERENLNNNLSPVSILKFSRSKNDWILTKFSQRNAKGWRKTYLIPQLFTRFTQHMNKAPGTKIPHAVKHSFFSSKQCGNEEWDIHSTTKF